MDRSFAQLLAALLIVGCYGGATGPAAGEMADLAAALSARGLSVDKATAGDPGCPDSPLYRDAVRLDLTYAADGESYVAYVFRWRNQAALDASAQDFIDCAAAHAGQTGSGIDAVGGGLWRAYGTNWSPEMTDVLEDSFNAAGG